MLPTWSDGGRKSTGQPAYRGTAEHHRSIMLPKVGKVATENGNEEGRHPRFRW